MTAKDTIAAEMAFMFGERNEGKSTIDYPVHGSKSIVDALVRGIRKNGGQVWLRTHVDEILVEGKFSYRVPSCFRCLEVHCIYSCNSILTAS